MITLNKTSPFTGKSNSMDLPITEQQLKDYYDGKSGLIQQAFPNLTADQREFILTGITPQEWDDSFKPKSIF